MGVREEGNWKVTLWKFPGIRVHDGDAIKTLKEFKSPCVKDCISDGAMTAIKRSPVHQSNVQVNDWSKGEWGA